MYDFIAKPVECINGDFISIRTHKLTESLLHRRRTRFGIGEAKDVLRLRIRFFQNIQNPCGQDLGFPRSRSGNYHNGSFNGINGKLLFCIEFLIEFFERLHNCNIAIIFAFL